MEGNSAEKWQSNVSGILMLSMRAVSTVFQATDEIGEYLYLNSVRKDEEEATWMKTLLKEVGWHDFEGSQGCFPARLQVWKMVERRAQRHAHKKSGL